MIDQNTITKMIEAILFYKGEPITKKEIHKILKIEWEDISIEEIEESLQILKQSLNDRGICLITKETPEIEYMLGTSKEAASLIEKIKIEELNKDLGRASLETLAIVIYQGPVRRSEIDHIRGVNSTFILRNLLVRGLIEKTPDPKDNRTSLYHPSFSLLTHLGITNIKDLPNFETVKKQLEDFEKEFNETEETQ